MQTLSERIAPSETDLRRGKILLLVLICLSLSISVCAVLTKMLAVGVLHGLPSVVRVVIESAMWAWLWTGSNVARIIWLVLFFLALTGGICIAMFAGHSLFFDSGATPVAKSMWQFMFMVFVPLAIYAAYGVYTLNSPKVRAFLDSKRPEKSAAADLLRRTSARRSEFASSPIDLNDFRITEQD